MVVSIRIFEDDSNRGRQLAIGNLVEYAASFVERESVRDEAREIKLAVREQIHERTHIAVGRPADVANGIILSAGDVVHIKHAVAHSSAEPKIDFLAEPRAPVEIDLRIAKTDDAATVTDKLGGHLNWLIAFCRRSQ